MAMVPPAQRVELYFWSFFPGIVTLLFAFFFLASKHVSGLNHVMPLLPSIPVFYWGMLHAREMPYWFVFALGLMMDAVMGLPLGLTSLMYIAFLLLLHAQRKYIHREGFVVKWGYFAILLAAIGSLNWFTLTLFYGPPSGLGMAFVQWLLTVCCYPVLHRAFDIVYDFINMRRWNILHGVSR
jgi:rod shape-determining protein MreD